jgi:hypothetical protein
MRVIEQRILNRNTPIMGIQEEVKRKMIQQAITTNAQKISLFYFSKFALRSKKVRIKYSDF